MCRCGRRNIDPVDSEDQFDIFANLQDFVYLNQILYQDNKDAREEKNRIISYEISRKYERTNLIDLLSSLVLVDKFFHSLFDSFCANPSTFRESHLSKCERMCHIFNDHYKSYSIPISRSGMSNLLSFYFIQEH